MHDVRPAASVGRTSLARETPLKCGRVVAGMSAVEAIV